jgi:DNA-binding GntR family transcriptional regulator
LTVRARTLAGKTIDKAVQVLKDEGLVHTVKGMGIYVTKHR